MSVLINYRNRKTHVGVCVALQGQLTESLTTCVFTKLINNLHNLYLYCPRKYSAPFNIQTIAECNLFYMRRGRRVLAIAGVQQFNFQKPFAKYARSSHAITVTLTDAILLTLFIPNVRR